MKKVAGVLGALETVLNVLSFIILGGMQIVIATQVVRDASARAGDPGGWADSGEFGGTLSSLSFVSIYMSAIWSLRWTKSRHSRIITCFDSMMCVWECYILFSGMLQYLVLKGNRTTNAT